MVACRPKSAVGEHGSPEHDKGLLLIKLSHWMRHTVVQMLEAYADWETYIYLFNTNIVLQLTYTR